MNTTHIIEQLDAEITRLQRIKELLSKAPDSPAHRGRPVGRKHSQETLDKIAAAARARWAKQKR